MNLCSTCIYWTPPKKFRDTDFGRGELWREQLGQCLNPTLLITYNPVRVFGGEQGQAKPDDAYVTGDHATLRTGPDFGCVKHSV